ncbi:MAG: malto-oligosyltrehalose trehalohydrolase [Rhodospirillales bacterium]|nr:malto-oligosyltrehalose trehalohydrolase [Rhodospirillales bacterium]
MTTTPSSSGRPSRFGAEVTADGVRFRLWAPDSRSVSLHLEDGNGGRDIDLRRDSDGWYETLVEGAGAGTRYRYRIDGDLLIPDPASRYQPDDVHGASEVVDPGAYGWRHTAWRGRPWEETVLYELHLGTFTPGGTFRSAIERLPHLAELGVTAVELMPVADFPGRWDWGYDGCYLFAPDAAYGRPEDLKALIDAAHGLGLMVFLDVVYNHFGPEGNYLYAHARRFFNPERETPWGAAINFDGTDSRFVRQFFIENAIYWLEEYRFDGLRFDAVHAIKDRSSPDILEEIADAVSESIDADRHVHLVLENDDNEARYLARTDGGRPRHYVAQWNDDSHHAYHVVISGESAGYYADYADKPVAHLGRCLTEGFAYQDDPSRFRKGERRGEASAHLPPLAFVDFLQNHDQIGNRAFGERISVLAAPAAVQAATAILLLAPSPPMLFMGEEWGAKTPFLFFCDFGPELTEPVREGRRREFASFPEFSDPAARERIPDPTVEATFRASALDWNDLDEDEHREWLALHRRLLEIRRMEIVPHLAGTGGHSGTWTAWGDRGLTCTWRLGDSSTLTLIANLSADHAPLPPERPAGRMIYAFEGYEGSMPKQGMPPWAVAWFLEVS